MNEDGRADARDDAVLLRLARNDAAPFRILYDRHVVRLHEFLLRRTGDVTAAFELTAETFARAWLSRNRFVDHGEGAAPWLFGIARHVLADSVRDRDVVAPLDAWLIGFDEDLADALSGLPEAQRRAVEMRVLDGSNYAEVGRQLEITPGAARVRVHRGLAALRHLLRPDRSVRVAAPPPSPRTPGDL